MDVHHRPLGHFHVAQFRGHLHDVLHAAACDRHLPPAGSGGIQHLLDTVYVGGEGGDDNALVAIGKVALEGSAHGAFRQGVAGTLHVGGVRQQRQHALTTQLTEAGKVDDLPINGGGVDLKVARVNYRTHAGVDGKGH